MLQFSLSCWKFLPNKCFFYSQILVLCRTNAFSPPNNFSMLFVNLSSTFVSKPEILLCLLSTCIWLVLYLREQYVYVLVNNTRVVPYFESSYTMKTMYYSHSYIYCIKVWYIRWLLCHKKDFCKIILILSIIINPTLKSENPVSCLCMIALFRCVRPAPLSTLREVQVLENA